jgi:succinate-semialdehyde dehydrogenase / glutarate-semialdehyde dehydrogenase
MMKIKSINPYSKETMKEFDLFTEDKVEQRIRSAGEAFLDWKEVSVEDRTKYIKKLAEVLRANPRKYAETITKEMGMPIKASLKSVEKCAWLCDYYSKNTAKFLKPENVDTEFKKSYVRFDPLGIVFIIMPWNYPFWQVFRQAVTSIAAGNVCLLKHASNVPQCALLIEEIFKDANFPKGVFTTLLIGSNTAMKIIDDDKVDAVSLTGSNKAGEQVGALAGKRIKPLVLELGGSDPFIVLEDADLEKAAQMAAVSRLLNAGQSCISAKRLIVVSKVADEFTKLLIKNFEKMKIGDPMDESTDIGPLARPEFVEQMNEFLQDAESKGAKVHKPLEAPKNGFFFAPCIVSQTSREMKILSSEIFGPIAPIIVVDSEQDAIKEANNTEFGLGSSLWTKDTEKGEKMAKKLEAGFVGINDITKSDPRLPFGGIKKSGVGRELSHFGLKEFVNVKTVVIKGD